MTISGSREIAVFVDGESLSAGNWPELAKALACCGRPSLLRIFADFSNASHAAWLPVCRGYGMEPVLHMPVASGKNGTDIVITIAVMDLLRDNYRGTIVLCSNDRDFLPLARRIRLAGNRVSCLATRAANSSERMVFDDWLVLKSDEAETVLPRMKNKPKPATHQGKGDPFLIILHKLLDQNRQMTLSEIGKHLATGWPDVHKAIGKNKLKTRIVRDCPDLSVDGNLVRKI